MKKHGILSLFLAFSLWVGLFTVPAGAYYIDYDKDGTLRFRTPQEDSLWWNDHSSELLKQDLNLSTKLPMIGGEFLDDLVLMQYLGGKKLSYRYVDRDCNIYDLDRNRYESMYSFSEGLAAALVGNPEAPFAKDVNWQICYVDKQGNEVFRLDPSIACIVKYKTNWCVGYFQNGRACVMRGAKKQSAVTPGIIEPLESNIQFGFEYAYIDTTGKVVTDWTYTVDPEVISRLPLYEKHGEWIGHLVSDSRTAENAPLFADQAPEVEVPFKATHPDGTYGQAQVDFLGYTIDPENLYNGMGYIVAQVTNATPNWDEGDLFHLLYSRYLETGTIIDSTTEFLPCGSTRQIHYEIEPWGVKILKIPTNYVINENKKLLWAGFVDMNPHWTENPYVDESRSLLLQAETYTECTRLVDLFKRAHGYPEMQLDYKAYDGVTLLGAPMPTISSKEFLDQELSAFTSQF